MCVYRDALQNVFRCVEMFL